jgi:hypothetical protein
MTRTKVFQGHRSKIFDLGWISEDRFVSGIFRSFYSLQGCKEGYMMFWNLKKGIVGMDNTHTGKIRGLSTNPILKVFEIP